MKVLMFLCFFVGCLNCYARDTINPINGKTMQELHENTLEKICYLKEQGFNVIEMWECELRKEMERNEDMKKYFEEYELVDPLQPRDAFFGGRTNAAKLFHECKEDEEIRYGKFKYFLYFNVYLMVVMYFQICRFYKFVSLV